MNEHGKHIKVQVYGAEFAKLKDTALIERLLIDLVHAAGMRELDEPWVYDIRQELERQGVEPDPDEPEGVTGIVVLSTSHCAIHTWPHRGYAVIDAYSCADFETEPVTAVVEETFEPKRVTVFDLSYALELPPPPT